MGLQEGLIGHWTMDDVDTQNGVLRDRSGHAHNGTLNGGVTTGNSSPVGESHSFDATDDFIDIVKIAPTDAVTYTAWTYCTAKDAEVDEACIIGLDTGGPWNKIGVYGQTIRFTVGTNNGTLDLDGSVDVFNNSWNHVAGVYDGSEARIYVDGKLDASTAHSGTLQHDSDNTTIGKWPDYHNADGNYGGELSSVRLYNRALSADEVSMLADQQTPRHTGV